jgi:hypothetical protein
MITYLIKEGYAEAAYARPARVRAFTDYLQREVPGSRVVSTEVGGGSRSLGGSVRAVGRLVGSLWAVASSGNDWVVVDYPNYPASVPRRASVFAIATVYTAALRLVCRVCGMGLVVQSDDDPAMQDEWLGNPLSEKELSRERRFERQLFRSPRRCCASATASSARRPTSCPTAARPCRSRAPTTACSGSPTPARSTRPPTASRD